MSANWRDNAPGRPEIEPRWRSIAKSGVGAAAGPASPLVAVRHGSLDEIHWFEVDRRCTRDMEFVVIKGADVFSEKIKLGAAHRRSRAREIVRRQLTRVHVLSERGGSLGRARLHHFVVK